MIVGGKQPKGKCVTGCVTKNFRSQLPIEKFYYAIVIVSVPVAARSRAWVCGRSLAGVAGSNPAGRHGCLSVVSVVCCQAEVSVSG